MKKETIQVIIKTHSEIEYCLPNLYVAVKGFKFEEYFKINFSFLFSDEKTKSEGWKNGTITAENDEVRK